jgi:hypothetical protein
MHADEREKEREGEKEEASCYCCIIAELIFASLQRARLKALKAHDMAAYAALVQKTKNERLTFLLQQTEAYLASLAQLVGVQQVRLLLNM